MLSKYKNKYSIFTIIILSKQILLRLDSNRFNRNKEIKVVWFINVY